MLIWSWKRPPGKRWPPGKHRFARSGERLIHDFTVSTAHVRNINGCKLQHGILNHCKNQAFFNYFHFKIFFLILVHACFTFRKCVTKIECLYKYSNHCFVFLNREYISYSGQHIFRKYWKEYYTLCKDVVVEKKVACANFDDRN